MTLSCLHYDRVSNSTYQFGRIITGLTSSFSTDWEIGEVRLANQETKR